MKFKKAVLTTCLLTFGAGASAQQALSPPQQAVKIKEHNHGVPEQVDHRAPIASLVKQHDDAHSLKHTPFTLHKAHANNKLKASAQAVQAAVCNVNAFATSNTNTLISEIKTQGPNCVNELFGAASNIQSSAYSSDNMYAVANHVKGLSQSYAGGGDVDIEALFLYLRAGYYVEFYNNNVSFVSWVKPAVKGAIDAFVNNANFYQDNDAHGKTLSEVIIAMDSSEQQDVYLPVVKEWLSRWNQSMGQKWNMRGAVNGIFTILFRGQYNENFKTLIANDTTLIQRLSDFTLQEWMVNSDSEYLIANASRELGRFKMYTGTAIQSSVDTALNKIFNHPSYVSYGYGDAVWLGAADTAGYYGNCTDFGICNYKADLEANVLSQTHICSPTIKIRSQNLTATQQQAACSKMGYEETYFHNKLETGNVPIPGDNNSQLVVNIFDSDTDYGKYGGHIFGIDTNNGGMYLEGNPADPNNIPNFVAYEASYANADHYIWNLEHEYVHYLDGRFDLFGDFNAPTEAVVWWAEGVAEYIANQDYNPAAIETINDGSTYTLGAIFDTTYAGFDQDRIYRWGYLAVRFMFERHFNEVKAMLQETRAGNWTAYKSRLNRWASDYGNEFTTWTQGLTNGTPPPTGNNAPTADANGPYTASVDSPVSFSSAGSVDSDGTIVSYLWEFGDGATSNQANPSHTYATAGDYLAKLTITDDKGATGLASATVTITGATQGNTIANGETKANLSAATGEWLYFTMNVPAGATNLTFATSGGSGDVDMYTQVGAQPTSGSYQCRPYASGNSESCTEASPQAGTWHVGLRAYSSFSGVSLTASYDSGQTQNQAPTAKANGPYSSAEGSAISFSSNGSSDSDGSITSYSWDFGDGTTSTQANPSHTYNAAGTYTVSLTVTDNQGASDTVSTTATVSASNIAPTAAINGPYSGDADVAVSFSSAGSSDSDGSIASYSWDFGDGTTSTQANPSHTYTTAGSFTVTLSVTDDQGATDSMSTTATITGSTTPPPSGGLTNGVAQSISGAQDSENSYTVEVPAGASNLRIETNGGSGDADLHVKFGSAATQSNYDCRPYKSGNNEVCEITNVQAGTYHIMVRGYNAYTTNLTASFTEPGGSTGNVPDMCAVQGPQSSGEVQDGQAICLGTADPIWLTIPEVNEFSSIAISTGNGSGDLSIDFSNAGWPNGSNHHGSSNNAGNGECIYLTNLSQYWGYIKVSGGAQGASLVVDFDTAGCR